MKICHFVARLLVVIPTFGNLYLFGDAEDIVEAKLGWTTNNNLDPSEGVVIYNGKVGHFKQAGQCPRSFTSKCYFSTQDLCANNMCSPFGGKCNTSGDGCLGFLNEGADCVAPGNVCGSGYCGTPPSYDDCQCFDGTCSAVVFEAYDGSSAKDVHPDSYIPPEKFDDSTIIGGPLTYNGVYGYYHKVGQCSTARTSNPQCKYSSATLCSNNMCPQHVTSKCNSSGDGCVDLLGYEEACVAPDNLCGTGYCGTPPIYNDCQCENNQCFAVTFVADSHHRIVDPADDDSSSVRFDISIRVIAVTYVAGVVAIFL